MELPDIVKEEIDLLVSGNFLLVYLPYQSESEKLEILTNITKEISEKDNFIILMRHEVSEESDFIDSINDSISYYGKNVKILQSTASSKVKNGTHPLTNIYMWSKIVISSDYTNPNEPHIIAFPSHLYESFPNFIEYKSNSSILSLHNESSIRNYVCDKIDTSKIGIFRFHSKENTTPIHWYDLIEEYKSSYFSFVMETNYGTWSSNCLTEKTILALITGTIPIIIGQDNLVKDLKSIGFWLPNNDLSADDFIDSISSISEMSNEEIHYYYINNLDNINNNWKIISNLFKYKNKEKVDV